MKNIFRAIAAIAALSFIASCGDTKEKEEKLQRERDESRSELQQKEVQHGYDIEFSTRYMAYLTERERVWYFANIYLKTGNLLQDQSVQIENRANIQTANHEIAKNTNLFDSQIQYVRTGQLSGDTLIETIRKLGELAMTSTAEINNGIMAATKILNAEIAAMKNPNALDSLAPAAKADEALNYVNRKEALESLINSYIALKTTIPKIACYTFPPQCHD